MEERTKELNPASSFEVSSEIMNYFSSLSSHPLFSTIVALYTLILLYLPTYFLTIITSPVFVSTGILLLVLLRFGAVQGNETDKENEKEKEMETKMKFCSFQQLRPAEEEEKEEEQQQQEERSHELSHVNQALKSSETGLVESETKAGFHRDYEPKLFFADSFVEWDVRAPLEVIYEAYEGEEDENDDISSKEEKNDNPSVGLERHASLSLYYPETDSDSSSSEGDFPVIGDWDSLESLRFRWEEEDKEELIEIKLDGKGREREGFHVEEDNLIEIEIFPARNGEDCWQK